MADIFTYRIGNTLYLNLTNRCTARCTFCRRLDNPTVKGYNLRLRKEPSSRELIGAMGDPKRFDEVVFCGYGEPTLRLKLLKEVAHAVKSKGGCVRLNTNGHGNLIHKRNILPELAGLVDSISVSLNAESPENYLSICQPAYGLRTYDEILVFIEEARKYIPQVIVSVVHLPTVDVKACEQIARKLGVGFRLRELNAIG